MFGRLGDLVGRKNTFLVTMALMGLSTFLVGLLPSYASIGVAAPVAARHACGCCRGLRWAASMAAPRPMSPSMRPRASRGLLHQLHPDDRDARPVRRADRGHRRRAPAWARKRSRPGAGAFRSSSRWLLLAVSLWIRLQLEESPVFRQMKAEGTTSKAPLTEAFAQMAEPEARADRSVRRGRRPGGGLVHRSILRAVLPREDRCKVDGATANIMIAIALAIGTPFFLFFGWLSDRSAARRSSWPAACSPP